MRHIAVILISLALVGCSRSGSKPTVASANAQAARAKVDDNMKAWQAGTADYVALPELQDGKAKLLSYQIVSMIPSGDEFYFDKVRYDTTIHADLSINGETVSKQLSYSVAWDWQKKGWGLTIPH